MLGFMQNYFWTYMRVCFTLIPVNRHKNLIWSIFIKKEVIESIAGSDLPSPGLVENTDEPFTMDEMSCEAIL